MSQILSDVRVVASASSSLDIKWTVNTLNSVTGFVVRHQHEGSQRIIKSTLLEPSISSYVIDDLDANTQYRVCVDVYSKNFTSPSAVCIDALTSSWHVPVSIGSSIGALLALVIIVIIVMVARFKGSKRTRKFKANGEVGKSFFSSTETEASRNFEMSEISIHADDECSFYSENYEDDLNLGDPRLDAGENAKLNTYYMQVNSTTGNSEGETSITPVRNPRQVHWSFSDRKYSQEPDSHSDIGQGQGQNSLDTKGFCMSTDADLGVEKKSTPNGKRLDLQRGCPLVANSLSCADQGEGKCQGHHTCELSPEVKCCTLGCSHSNYTCLGSPNRNMPYNTEVCRSSNMLKEPNIQNSPCMCSLTTADVHVHRPGKGVTLTPSPILKKNNNNVDCEIQVPKRWTKREAVKEHDPSEANMAARDFVELPEGWPNVAMETQCKDLFRNISAPGCVEAASIQPICTVEDEI
ncbi:uncharacterized protein LOC106150739 [Lingula anatina]|uniref:Uncharacterized protein LOC106150739 n=1 Tax=Lingula anatina TaxID=7574 RepID=A0A1S3GZJ7_LINAN|nr:uncharacterized protein LOC106150739 [Lingula anatina]|eukprot:XP_013379173.1 uncharacterized protein LOC106150739 [Lingula anatina]